MESCQSLVLKIAYQRIHALMNEMGDNLPIRICNTKTRREAGFWHYSMQIFADYRTMSFKVFEARNLGTRMALI